MAFEVAFRCDENWAGQHAVPSFILAKANMTIHGLIPMTSASERRGRWRRVILIMTSLGALACNESTDPSQTTYTIELSPASVTLAVPPGEPRSVVMTATVRTNRGAIVSPAAVLWTTDSLGVATVSQTGTVTAVGEGSTLLRARFEGAEASATITVSVPITFTATGSMSTTRMFHTATLLADGKVLIVGGMDRVDALGRGLATAELYDPSSGTFVRTGDMTKGRSGHSAVLLTNGKVLIAGGTDGVAASGTAELYDPATRTFSRTGDMRSEQVWHEATLLNNGKVLISGGGACCGPANPELYDVATGEFTTTGAYARADTAREMSGLVALKATLLRDGRVLLTSQPAAQVYDPLAGTFSRTGSMITGAAVFGFPPSYINGQTATLLNDGRVLLTGGHHEDIGRFKSAELYDPATGRFALTGTMASVRDGHTATLLADGTVMVTGGESESGCAVLSLGKVEIYDLSKGGFTPAGRMNVRREWHTATRLNDGRVLVTGGLTFDGGLCGPVSFIHLASAELSVLRN